MVGDGHHICFASNSFDSVVAMEVLEHVPRPVEMVRELVRVCEPGGEVIITVPDGEHDRWSGHLNFWTQDDLRQMLGEMELQQRIERLSENNVLVAVLAK